MRRRPNVLTGRGWRCAVAGACVFARAASAQTLSPSRLLLESISTPAFKHVQMHCRDIGIQEFYAIGIIAGCMGTLGDTLFIAYRTRDGSPLALTKQFFVERSRLSLVGDSVRAELSREFGPALHCPRTMWTGTHWDSWQWHVGAMTIQLAANAQDEPLKFNHRRYPWIGVQFAQTTLACGDWLPEAVPIDRVRR